MIYPPSPMRERSRTRPFPDPEYMLFPGFLGEPVVKPGGCPVRCGHCERVCPTGAISVSEEMLSVQIDLGQCIFCGECAKPCVDQSICFSKNYMLSTRNRKDLIVTAVSPLPRLQPLPEERRVHFAHSLRIRFLSVGGCGGCRLETATTMNPVMDAARFGMSFVDSPMHANALMVSGPALNADLIMDTWVAIPSPKLYIALGGCQISGGLFADGRDRATPSAIVPDLYIPGCPPHPMTILHGLLTLIGRFPSI